MGLRCLLLCPPHQLLLLCCQLAVYCYWCQLQMKHKHSASNMKEIRRAWSDVPLSRTFCMYR
jgi:hypothetical protein